MLNLSLDSTLNASRGSDLCFPCRSVFPLHEGDREGSVSCQDVGEGEGEPLQLLSAFCSAGVQHVFVCR